MSSFLWLENADDVLLEGGTDRLVAEDHVGGATVERSASITLTPAVTSAATFYSILERSASVDITPAVASSGVGETPTFSPDDIAGLEIWLEADAIGLSDGANVTTWEDSSVNNRDFTAAAGPTYQTNEINGLPVVRFDGVDDVFTRAFAANDATRTFFCVCRAATTTNAQTVFGWTSSSRLGHNGSDSTFFTNTSGAASGFGTVIGTTAHVVTIRLNSISSQDRYLDGGAASNIDPHDAWASGSATLNVGGIGGAFSSSDIAELLIYDTALSDTDLDDVRDYLTDKWIGVGPTVHERSAAITLTPAIASAQQNFSVLERSAAIALTPAVASVPQRVRLRSAAITLTPAVASAATFYSILTRSAAVAITPAIATAPQRVLMRATAITLTPGIFTAGQIEGGLVEHERSASVTLTPAVASAATFYSIIERAAAVAITPAVATAYLRVHVRSVAVVVTPTIASSGAVRLIVSRSAVITITPGISTLGFAGTIFQSHLPLTVEVREALLTVTIDEGDTSIIFDSSESDVIYDETTTDVASQGDRDAVITEYLNSVEVIEPVTTVDYEETPRTVEVP